MYEKSNQENVNFFGRIYGHVRFSISVIGFNYTQGYCNALDIHTFFVKFVVETFFFKKAQFYKVPCLLQWVSFSGKDYYVLLLVLLVLNKFIEINTLIKRNLNFKCEVKSHKVRFQAYCNKPLLKWGFLSRGCVVMTSLVPSKRWPLDLFPRGVPAADIWWP